MIDPPPISDLVQGPDRQFSFSWKRWLNVVQTILQTVSNYGIYKSVVITNASSTTFPSNVGILQLSPAGPLAAATVVFPASPFDKQEITIATTNSIAALTLSSAITINNPAVSLSAGGSVTYYYSLIDNKWFSLSGSGGVSPTTPPGGTNTQVQFNDSGVFAGNANFTYDKTTNTLTVAKFATANAAITGGSVNNTVIGAVTPVAGTFTALAAASLTGTGLALTVTPLAPTVAQDAGALTLRGQNATAATKDGGNVVISAGDGQTSGDAGTVTISSGTSNVGGAITIQVGASSSGNGADITIDGGNTSSALIGGAVRITAGSSSDIGGSVRIAGGASSGNAGGDVEVVGGDGPSAGGGVRVLAGNANVAGAGGLFSLTGGTGVTAFGNPTGAALSMRGGKASGDGGDGYIYSGDDDTNSSGGNLYISFGVGTVADGSVQIRDPSGNTLLHFKTASPAGAGQIGVFGATPIARPTTAFASATRVAGATTALVTDTYDGYTLAQIVKALRNLGILT